MWLQTKRKDTQTQKGSIFFLFLKKGDHLVPLVVVQKQHWKQRRQIIIITAPMWKPRKFVPVAGLMSLASFSSPIRRQISTNKTSVEQYRWFRVTCGGPHAPFSSHSRCTCGTRKTCGGRRCCASCVAELLQMPREHRRRRCSSSLGCASPMN